MPSLRRPILKPCKITAKGALRVATRFNAAGGRWQDTPLIKSRLAGGYCLRTAAQSACAYANICEHCPNFQNDPGFLTILAAQRADAQALAADAHARGWTSEASRHRKLVDQFDLLMSRMQAS